MIYLYVSLGIVGGIAVIWLFVWCNNCLLSTSRYALKAEVEKSVKIVHLSDLHKKTFGKKNRRLINKIEKERPDFIAITGDIIHKYRPKDIGVAVELVSALCAVAPVVFTTGNHEMRSAGCRLLLKDLKEAGAVVLDNSTAEICGLKVTGLNCACLKNGTAERIAPEDGVKILLAHMPQYIENYAEGGYDIVLCGHAHGGQWRIPFADRGIFAPGQGFFPKLTAGVHVCKNTKMVISRGLGNSQCPLRLFNPPEIVVVNIEKE